MSLKSTLLKGTFILTFASFLTRIMGFFYRIFLSRIFTAEEIGLYQLIFPVFTLGFALSAAGIQTAISRCTARYFAQNKKDKAIHILKLALLLSVLLSFFCILFIQANITYIATDFLGDERCSFLLLVMSYALPFACIHSCICGYYMGQKDCKIIANSQLLEQTLRIAFVLMFCLIFAQKNNSISIIVAVLGMIAGEFGACIYTLFHCRKELFFSSTKPLETLSVLPDFLKLATPLTANRLFVNFMQSLESVSIPLQLQAFGLDSSVALSIYGTFSGMALPCILFPSAITNALSSMLLPTIAEFQISREKKELRSYIFKITALCFLLGSGCFLFFWLTGDFIGSYIFHSTQAGEFITALSFICPFLYMNTTLLTTINGLGNTFSSFLINAISLSFRICSVYLLIPSAGMNGYLIGLFSSQILTAVMSLFRLNQLLS